MNRGYMLLANELSGEGSVCEVTFRVKIDGGSHQWYCHPVEMDKGGLKDVATGAFERSVFELDRMAFLGNRLAGLGIVGFFTKDSAIHPSEGSSAGLLFALLTAAGISSHLSRKPLNYSFAATGVLGENSNEAPLKSGSATDDFAVGDVSFINEKLEAALEKLQTGDCVFLPAGNDSKIKPELRRKFQDKGVRLNPVSTLREGIEALNLDNSEPESTVVSVRPAWLPRLALAVLMLTALTALIGALRRQSLPAFDSEEKIANVIPADSMKQSYTVKAPGENEGVAPVDTSTALTAPPADTSTTPTSAPEPVHLGYFAISDAGLADLEVFSFLPGKTRLQHRDVGKYLIYAVETDLGTVLIELVSRGLVTSPFQVQVNLYSRETDAIGAYEQLSLR